MSLFPLGPAERFLTNRRKSYNGENNFSFAIERHERNLHPKFTELSR